MEVEMVQRKIKLRATLTVTVDYDVPEGYDGCKNISELCRHEEAAIRNDPTDLIDVPKAKIVIKVERVKTP